MLKRDPAKLQRFNKRLEAAVAELLRQVDELDQESQFSDIGLGPQLSERLAKVCSALVTLSEAVNMIAVRIESSELESARNNLLSSLAIANRVSRELSSIKQEFKLKRSQSQS